MPDYDALGIAKQDRDYPSNMCACGSCWLTQVRSTLHFVDPLDLHGCTQLGYQSSAQSTMICNTRSDLISVDNWPAIVERIHYYSNSDWLSVFHRRWAIVARYFQVMDHVEDPHAQRRSFRVMGHLVRWFHPVSASFNLKGYKNNCRLAINC